MTVATIEGVKCVGCNKTLYCQVRYNNKNNIKVNRPAGYNMGYLCEDCVDFVVRK